MIDMEKETFRQIGIDLINEYRVRGGFKPIDWLAVQTPEASAFIRSIQLHEKTKKELESVKQDFADFKKKVSDALVTYANVDGASSLDGQKAWRDLVDFIIIPKPKPDPLVEVLMEMELSSDPEEGQHDAKWLRIKLDALGFEIREKNDE